MPFGDRIGGQPVIVLVIAVDKKRGKRLSGQPFPPVLLLMRIVPDAAEVAADDQIVAEAAGKMLAPEPLKFAVRVAGYIDHTLRLLMPNIWYIHH